MAMVGGKIQQVDSFSSRISLPPSQAISIEF